MARHTILIVDDEPDVQMLLRLFFERQGHITHRARDGQEAVDIALQVVPDIILMDIQMPLKTGVDAVKELRSDARFASTPMIALTAYARKYAPADVIRAGFDRVLFKPFDFAELQAMIAELLHSH
jgi:CheY-like chemotaxis protein